MTVALVLNPTKVSSAAALRRMVDHPCRERGRPESLVLETTVADPGEQMVRHAVEQGADLVLSAGGDVPSWLCPGAWPAAGSARAAGHGHRQPARAQPRTCRWSWRLRSTSRWTRSRRLDLGMLSTEQGAPPEAFVVMAGVGFDAAMMADAPARLTSVAGWAPYLLSGVRHLRDRPMQVELTVDVHEPVRRAARSVVVGNVGMLQAGLRLLPDDGLLDVVVLSPLGLLDWARVLVRLASRRPGLDRDVERFQGKHVSRVRLLVRFAR
ncbi:MAG: diacylglycerol/lipid kinase family protein [Mycobacteriales bacterium]